MEYVRLDVVQVQIAQTTVLVKTENAKTLVTNLVHCVERILNVTLTITKLFVCALMDSKENQILNARDILVIKMTIVRRIRNVVSIKFVEILVWSKELVDPMHSAKSQIEWLIVPVLLGIMEMLN